MVRGLIFGVIWGGIVTAVFLAAISLMLPLPERTGGGVVPVAAPSVVGQMPQEEPTPTPLLAAPTVEESPKLAETTSAIVPTAGGPESDLPMASATDEPTPDVALADQPDLDAALVKAPVLPKVETQPVLNIETIAIAPDQGDTTGAAGKPETETMATQTPATPEPKAQTTATDRLPSIPVASSETEKAVKAPAAPQQDGRPLMSIILIDTGEFKIGPEALANFPYPITFAIDPLRSDALSVAQAYQDKGYEVLLTVDLPADGDAQLAQLALEPMLESFPGVVGVLEGAQSGVQGNMNLADGVLDVVAASDKALILRSKGLNAALQQAEGRGLLAGLVFRDFDGAGQNAAVIRRFLDQAAFKARQEGAVIMVGRLRPATISALLLWGLQDRARTVRLVPVSEILGQ